DSIRVDDVGRAQWYLLISMQNPERFGQFLLIVGKHGISEMLKVGMILPPGEVHELAVRAATQHHCIAIFECAQFLVELGDLGRTHKREIQRPEKDNAPFSTKLTGRDGLEL